MPRSTDLYFIIAIAAIIAAGFLFTYTTAVEKDAGMREQLLTEARLAEAGIDAGQVAALAGADSDLLSPPYMGLKEQMVRFHEASPGVRFAYLIGKRADSVYFFYVDSEPPNSPDYSPPGQDYPEAMDYVKEAYTTGTATAAGPATDRWGTWVSGLVPVKDKSTGKIVALYGMDVDARNWNRDIAGACVLPVTVTLTFLILLGVFYVAHKRRDHENSVLKASEKALQESERRLSQIIGFLPDATFAIDSDGKVIAWNRAIEEMTGIPASEIIGKGDYEYAIPFYGTRRPILIDLVFKPEEEIRKDYTYVTIENTGITGETVGARPLEKDVVLWGRASALYDADGAIIGAIESIRDVTERRRLQDSLDAVNRRLHLLASITRHDIINKVTVSLGITSLVKKKTEDPLVLDLIMRLERVIGDIRYQAEFTRVYQEVGVKAPAWQDVGAIFAACNATAVTVAPFHGKVEVFADPMLPKVFANLLENTVRHGRKATTVAVYVEPSGENLAIVYEDDGAGVPVAEKELIFERGYGKNTGLGLFLAREILAITGITIRETGEPGTGARFEIVVPKGLFRTSSDIPVKP